jgi:hypothetical protein
VKDPGGSKRIDPELLRQLESASAGNVQAVFVLKPSDPEKTILDPEETEAVVKRVLKRVARQTGTKPDDSHVFRNLQSFVLDAPATFVRRLIEQKEIAAATANRRDEGQSAT